MSDDSSGLQADGARGTDTDRLPQHYERELFVRMEEKIKFPCEPNQTSVAFLNPCRRVSDPFTSSSLESAEHKRLLHQRPMLDICIVFLFAPLIFIYIYIYIFLSVTGQQLGRLSAPLLPSVSTHSDFHLAVFTCVSTVVVYRAAELNLSGRRGDCVIWS